MLIAAPDRMARRRIGSRTLARMDAHDGARHARFDRHDRVLHHRDGRGAAERQVVANSGSMPAICESFVA